MKYCYYSDAPAENATLYILRQLGYLFLSPHDDTETQAKTDFNDVDQLVREHKTNDSMTLKLIRGSCTIEIRDTSDSWIKLELEAGECLQLPAGSYRKVVIGIHSKYELQSITSELLCIPRFAADADSVGSVVYHQYRELVCELCRQFFQAGWVTGTGGSISIKFGNRIYMTPSGVQKERIKPDELFTLDSAGNVLCTPNRKPSFMNPKLSDCAPLFLHAYQIRNAGAVLHSHAFSANLITSIFEGKSEFRIAHQEMIKGIFGHGYYDELVVPIIENTAWEHELADKLGETITAYPKTFAVLVRRHGMYVWGRTWEEAKRHGECLHYLFEVVINMKKLGLDYTRPPVTASPSETTSHVYKHVVFDIEGTVIPISFVKDVLFPYAAKNAKSFLQSTWDTAQTKGDVSDLHRQYALDSAEASYTGPSLIQTGAVDAVISSLTEYIQWNIINDRKVGSLKQLQGHIWGQGYRDGSLKSTVYDDVPAALERLKSKGTQISIYSSGSRLAQSLIFKHSTHGDLRNKISVYFDTKVGNKREKESYDEIALYLGVDSPSEVLFVTDVYEEAVAASSAGFNVLISVRDGNAPLPAESVFPCVSTFVDL